MAAICTTLALIASIIFFAGRRKDRPVTDVLLYSITSIIFSHIVITSALLIPDMYTVGRSALFNCLFWIALAVIFFVKGDRPKVDFDIREALIPLIAVAVMVPALAATPFDYFGMGQDQGVFQTEAIMYIRGNTSKQIDIEEYHLAVTSNEKRQIIDDLTYPNLHGTTNYDDCNIFKVLTGESAGSVNEVSQVFHGLHILSSLLALWGTLFGIRNMAGINILMYALCLMWIYKICRKLKAGKLASAAAVIIFAVSPQAIWAGKSTLTEIGIALIWMVFIYFVTGTGKRDMYLAALTVGIYGLYHVSCYVFVPLFALIFIVIYLRDRERYALKAMLLMDLAFFISFTADVLNNADYTLRNYSPVFYLGIDKDNVAYLVAAASVLLAVIGAVMLLVRPAKIRIPRVVGDNIVRVLLLIAPAYIVMRLLTGANTISNAPRLTFIALSVLMGIVIPAVVYLHMLIFPSGWTDDRNRMTLILLYIYCVVIYSVVMIKQVSVYYYSRYLLMYIPMIAIMSAVIFTSMKKRIIPVIALALSVAVILPYSYLLLESRDDSRVQWDTLSKVEQTLRQRGADAVFIEPSIYYCFYYDVKSMGMDVYPIFDRFDEEAADVNTRYEHMYIIDDGTNAEQFDGRCRVVLRIENRSIQDYGHMVSRLLLPEHLTVEYQTYTIYEYIPANI